jgi:uncharacterized protein YwqG
MSMWQELVLFIRWVMGRILGAYLKSRGSITRAEVMRVATLMCSVPPSSLEIIIRPTSYLKPVTSTTSDRRGSRAGGLPALPPGVEWPSREGIPLAFVAQLDLSEQPASLAAQGFPTTGLLLFFIDLEHEHQIWGHKPSNRDGFRVIYVENPHDAVVPSEFPEALPDDQRLNAMRFQVSETWSIIPWEYALGDNLLKDYSEDERYWDLQDWIHSFVDEEEWGRGSWPNSLLGGFPQQMQADLTMGAEKMNSPCALKGWQDLNWVERRELQQGALNWQLLFQLGAVGQAGMKDHAWYYFMVRTEDLRARQFDQVWMIVQRS